MPGLSSPGESRVGCPGSDCVKGPMFLDVCARAFFTWGITAEGAEERLCANLRGTCADLSTRPSRRSSSDGWESVFFPHFVMFSPLAFSVNHSVPASVPKTRQKEDFLFWEICQVLFPRFKCFFYFL